jgi:carbamoyltransferase
MNILGINPSHHGSACLLQDGEIKLHFQEERFTRRKYDNIPYYSIIDIALKYPIDFVALGPPSIVYPASSLHYYDTRPISYFTGIVESINRSIHKYNKIVGEYDFSDNHHLVHATHAFVNSGFNEAACIVIDGMGSLVRGLGREAESIFHIKLPFEYNLKYKNILLSVERYPKTKEPLTTKEYRDSQYALLRKNIHVTTQTTIGRTYELVSEYLGWSSNEAGKTMGLSSYGKENPFIPPLFIGRGSNPFIIPDQNIPNVSLNIIDKTKLSDDHREYDPFHKSNEKLSGYIYPYLRGKKDPKKWHYNPNEIPTKECDIAWRVQNDSQELVGMYVKQAIEETGLKKVCCSGGYFLNCVTNYYLTKQFPDVEFYFEPVANDNGISIGSAQLAWFRENGGENRLRPLKSLYLGKEYSKKELLKGINKYVGK